MSSKRSQFGTLAQRVARSAAPPVTAAAVPVVRHVWVDGLEPGLVMDRRRDATGVWEGLVVRVTADGVSQEWISGARISTVS